MQNFNESTNLPEESSRKRVGIVQTLSNFGDAIKTVWSIGGKVIDQDQANAQDVNKTYDQCIEDCREERKKEGLSPEQCNEILDKELKAAENKDANNAKLQNHTRKILAGIGKFTLGLAGIVGAFVLGKYGIDAHFSQNRI